MKYRVADKSLEGDADIFHLQLEFEDGERVRFEVSREIHAGVTVGGYVESEDDLSGVAAGARITVRF